MSSALVHFPPMGVYQTLFQFLDATGRYMGTEGTHPWAQGFPLTTPLPDGPDVPTTISFTHADLKYPPATGAPELLKAIRDYYNRFHGASIGTENIAIFAGGRPGIYAILAFLRPQFRVLVEETEYTPYWDALKLLRREVAVIPSNPDNHFRPGLEEYAKHEPPAFVLKSNPCNPTGVTWRGRQLQELVQLCSQEGWGGLVDEAYEFFQPDPQESALRYVDDIERTNLFVVGAATKGLQAPGLRVGWVVSSAENTLLFRNFSSIAMGGVARPSQICAAQLLALDRVDRARAAVRTFYEEQRTRYRVALDELGFELFTGEGGFYHWGRLPGGLTADAFNRKLFARNAAMLPGPLCDMLRREQQSPLANFVRFSFGAVEPSSFEGNIAIMREALA